MSAGHGKLVTSEIATVETSLAALEAMSSMVRPGRLWCIDGTSGKGNDANSGRDWDNAKLTIQPVLTEIRVDQVAGTIPNNVWDCVLIAPGDYEEELVVPACHMVGLGTWGNDRGVRIISDSDPGVKGAVTAVTGISGLHLENIRFQSESAIKLLHMGVMNASWIKNCSFRGADGSPATVTHGIHLENALGVHILDCRFEFLNKGIYLGPSGPDKFFNEGEIARCCFNTQAEAITIVNGVAAYSTYIYKNHIIVNTAVAGISIGNVGTTLVSDNYVSTAGGTPITHGSGARLIIGNHTHDGTTCVDPNTAKT